MFSTLVLVGGLLLAQAETTPSSDLSVEVRRLTRQLNALQSTEREAAEKKLIELGPDVLELLPKTTPRTPAEVTQRLARVRQALQRQLAKSTVAASKVTLQGKMSIAKVLDAFQKQTGNQIAYQRNDPDQPDGELEVDFDGVPFWEALDQVLDQAGLGVDPYGLESDFSVKQRREGQANRVGRAAYGGPFRFDAARIVALRDLRNADAHSMRLFVETAWEPRIRPISLILPTSQLKAVDDRDQQVTLSEIATDIEIPVFPDTLAVELEIPITPPPRAVGKIARLEGRITALVPGKIETFRFAKIKKAQKVEKRIAGVTVTLDRVALNNDLWQVFFRVRFDDASDALASHRGWVLDNEALLEKAGSEPILPAAYETMSQTENEVGIAYLFVLDDNTDIDDYQFVYKSPGMIFSTEFDFVLENIELP